MRFFMHLANRYGVVIDDEGIERASIGDAIAHATQSARSIISHDAAGGIIDLEQSIIIEADGCERARVDFPSAITALHCPTTVPDMMPLPPASTISLLGKPAVQ